MQIAQITSPFSGVTVPGGNNLVSSNGDIGGIITAILPFIFSAAAMLLLVYMAIGGLQMMTSRGDPKAMQSAQGKITNALIGFVIVIIAVSLVLLIGQLLGINVFSQIF